MALPAKVYHALPMTNAGESVSGQRLVDNRCQIYGRQGSNRGPRNNLVSSNIVACTLRPNSAGPIHVPGGTEGSTGINSGRPSQRLKIASQIGSSVRSETMSIKTSRRTPSSKRKSRVLVDHASGKIARAIDKVVVTRAYRSTARRGIYRGSHARKDIVLYIGPDSGMAVPNAHAGISTRAHQRVLVDSCAAGFPDKNVPVRGARGRRS